MVLIMLLNEIQKNFTSYIQGKETNPDFLSLFSENQISTDDKLSIYKGHYYERLTHILMETYPAVTNIVGKEFSRSMYRKFIESNPPQEACLNLYGSNLDKFINNFAPAKEIIYLSDVAKLEKLINESYYETDNISLEIEDLNNDLELELKSSVRLLKSEFPVDNIREFSTCGKDNYTQELNIDKGDIYLMINRIGFEVIAYRLEDSDFKLLNYISNSLPMEKSVELIINEYTDFNLSNFLLKFIEKEVFAKTPIHM